jgi:uncharacterized membrane protein
MSSANRPNLVGDRIHLTESEGSSVKRLVVLVALGVLVAVAASTALGRNARPDTTAACAKGAVAARIGGKSVCLRAGTACKATSNSIYKKHGFTCVAGHLSKTPTAKPPAPTPTPTPVPPYSPPTGTVGTANTTVTVELDDNPTPQFVFSQPTVPSGMVTFVITSKCVIGCSFDIDGVRAGKMLYAHYGDPSETWTVALAPGIYRYHCRMAPDLMNGELTVTP